MIKNSEINDENYDQFMGNNEEHGRQKIEKVLIKFKTL
jgi:hypothetical protein